MKTTKLTLENFRSFKEKQTIEFAPVTLLFGPNSVGKSTVLLALFYVRHILSKGDCNPQRIEELGGKYVGGFKGLVHGRDLKQTIRIGVEYSKGNTIGSSYTEFRDLLDEEELDGIKWLFYLPDASGTVEHVEIELAIDWSAQLKLAYVSECIIKLNKQEFATLRSSPGAQQASIESINYLHPLLVGDEHDEWLELCFDNLMSIHSKNASKVFALKSVEMSKEDFDADHDGPVIEDESFASAYHEALNDERIPVMEFQNASSSFRSTADNTMFMHAPIAFKSTTGAVPLLGRKLDATLSFDTTKKGALAVEILSDAIVPVFDNLLTLLEDSLCIGPLRTIPDPTYQPNPNPQSKHWHDGLAAWDYLEKSDLSFLSKVDHWMRERLNLGYGISLKYNKSYTEYKRISSQSVKEMKSSLSTTITDRLLGDDEMKVVMNQNSDVDENSESTEYTIWDSRNNIAVSPADIGVGVSQVLPFIVASLVRDRGLIAVEQPELHVHPRIQVGLGDLLTQANKNVGFLVETHSEHLILRLVKRIRQTTDNELPDGIKPVTKDDVSIIYLEESDSGVKAKRIHLDADGEFQQRWPHGFFAERREELM